MLMNCNTILFSFFHILIYKFIEITIKIPAGFLEIGKLFLKFI